MAVIARRSNACKIKNVISSAANDLDGTGGTGVSGTDVTGALRVIIVQYGNGTGGPASGIDQAQVSTDGGTTWADDTKLLLSTSDDITGTTASAALNAAGTQPTGAKVWMTGPFEGPTKYRVCRKTGTGGTTWTNGAPQIDLFVIGA